MTDSETIEAARNLFASDTPGDILARDVIAIAEQRVRTFASEVAHSRRLENQLRDLQALLEPLRDAVLYARSQRRPMGIGQDFPRTEAQVRLGIGIEYGRERDNAGFWIDSDDLGPQEADSPDPTKRIALALIRLAYAVAEKVKPRP